MSIHLLQFVLGGDCALLALLSGVTCPVPEQGSVFCWDGLLLTRHLPTKAFVTLHCEVLVLRGAIKHGGETL